MGQLIRLLLLLLLLFFMSSKLIDMNCSSIGRKESSDVLNQINKAFKVGRDPVEEEICKTNRSRSKAP